MAVRVQQSCVTNQPTTSLCLPKTKAGIRDGHTGKCSNNNGVRTLNGCEMFFIYVEKHSHWPICCFPAALVTESSISDLDSWTRRGQRGCERQRMGRSFRPETHKEQGTMQAAVMRAVGPPSVLQLETDFPMPVRCVRQSLLLCLLLNSIIGATRSQLCFPAHPHRRPGEVLVQAAAAAVNPIDLKTRGAQGGVPRWAVTLPKVSSTTATEGRVTPSIEPCLNLPALH